jgi:SOS regulatory protein LexA
MKLDQATKILRKFYLNEKRIPSYSEIADLFGYNSKSSAQHLVEKLIEIGILERGDKGKLLPKNLMGIPHLGIIKAGYPMPAYENHETIDVTRYLLSSTRGDIYFLTVSGDSMIDAQIAEGDKIIVDASLEPINGDIVAAIVDNEWTVKYYFKVNEKIELRPANKNYPIIYPTESLEIGGVVTGVVRKYR